jgi:hypothetical protein
LYGTSAATKEALEMIDWGRDDEYGKVTADRNRLIQLFIDEMLDKRVTLQRNRKRMAGLHRPLDEYLSCLGADARRRRDDGAQRVQDGSVRVQIISCSHAIYCRIGLDRFQNTMAKIFGIKESFPKAMIVGNEGVRAKDIPSPEIQQTVILNWDAPYEGIR